MSSTRRRVTLESLLHQVADRLAGALDGYPHPDSMVALGDVALAIAEVFELADPAAFYRHVGFKNLAVKQDAACNPECSCGCHWTSVDACEECAQKDVEAAPCPTP